MIAACAWPDRDGPCGAPAAWTLTAGGVRHPVCGQHKDVAEDRLTDLEQGRVLAERIDVPADEQWHWCDAMLIRAHLDIGGDADRLVLSEPARRVLDRILNGEELGAEDRARLD